MGYHGCMSRNPIIALVGPSGSGKTTIMMEVFKRLPDIVFPMVSLASRPKREPEDDVFYRFVAADVIREKFRQGEMAQFLEYAGNVYGSAKQDIESVLSKGIGMQAYVEQGVIDLRAAGYTVIPVKVSAESLTYRGDEKRIHADTERNKTHLDYQLFLHNSFEPGGLTHAVDQLVEFILSLKR